MSVVRQVRLSGFNLTQSLLIAPRLTYINPVPTLAGRGATRYAIRYMTGTTVLELSENEANLLALINAPDVKPYSAEVVQDAILSVFSKQIPEVNIESFKLYYIFVKTNFESLLYLNDFICNSSPRESSELALLTSVELTNTLFLFKDLLKKNKLPNLGNALPPVGLMELMVEEFLILLLNRRAAHALIPHAVGSILKSKLVIDDYNHLFAAGVGKFIPEVSSLQKQFNFSKLESFEPVSEGISWLTREFTEYSKSQEKPHDPAFYDTLIPVMRYSHLLASLRSLNTNFVKPQSVVCLASDPRTPDIQAALLEYSGEASQCDNVIFGNQRNFLNTLFCTTGLGNFDKILSYLLQRQKSDASFTNAEQSKIKEFLDTILPLVANGVIKSGQLSNIKYGCLVARFNDNVLKPFKVSENIFDNYEFSLLVLLDLADYAYILRPVRKLLSKPFEQSSFAEIEDALNTFTSDCKPIIQRDAENFKSALKVYAAYSLRNFLYFDRIIADECLMNAIEKQEDKHLHITEMSPNIIEVTVLSLNKSFNSDSSVLNKFADVLCALRTDIGIDFSEFSLKTISRLIGVKLDALKNDLDERYSDQYLTRLQDLSEALAISSAEGGFNSSELELISQQASVSLDGKRPCYVQVPDDLRIHEFVEELVILRDDVLHGNFETFTADEVISGLRERLEVQPDLSLDANKNLVIRLGVLANKLCRLFMINGNNTEVLDAIIRSHNVFGAFEARIQEKRSIMEEVTSSKENLATDAEYYQIPDTFHIHTFVGELMLVHEYLKRPFSQCTADEVLDAVRVLSMQNPTANSATALQALYWNLVALFRHNNDHTSVLDATIKSQSVFTQFEKSLKRENQRASTEKYHTVASYQKELAAKRVEVYNSSPRAKQIVSKDDAGIVAEAAIADTEAADFSSEDNTSEVSTQTALKNDLEHILRKANKERKTEEKERFREREAYIWSTSMLKSLGTLETKQFFTLAEKNKFPMFPGVDNDAEYLVLAPKGRTILSKSNPLGATHIPEDMLSILERLSESEIVKYSPSLAKLQKKGWSLIGSGNNNLILVFSRAPKSYRFSFVKIAKLLLSTAGFVFITLFGLNYILHDPNEQHANGMNQSAGASVDNNEVLSLIDHSDNEPSQRSNWHSFLWKISTEK